MKRPMNRHEVCGGRPYKIRVKTLRVQIASATTYTNAGEYQEPSQVSLRYAKKPASAGFFASCGRGHSRRHGEGAAGGVDGKSGQSGQSCIILTPRAFAKDDILQIIAQEVKT